MTKDEATSANGVHIDSQLAALTSVPENAQPSPLTNQLQDRHCAEGDSVPSQRGALIINVFHVKEGVDHIGLAYMVSPPGERHAKMSEMTLGFSFSGDSNGSIEIWLNRPRRFRDVGLYKFGLGVTEVQQGHDCSHTVIFAKDKEFLTSGRAWAELKLDGENLMGGELLVTIRVRYACRGTLSVHMSASASTEDPKEEVREITDEEMEEYMEYAERRWSSLAYQREILGGETMEEYLEH